MPPRLVCAAWVVPVSGPPIADGAVAVEDGRIRWVGRADDRSAPEGPRTDLGSGVLLPGLVNAHCHLELSHLAGRLPRDGGFVRWVEALVHEREREDPARVRARAGEAIRASEETGTAAVGDVSNTLIHLDLIGASRLHAMVFYELLGWDPTRAEAIVRAALERLDGMEGRAEGRVRVRLAAHAPHSVSADLLRALAARGGPAAVHLAESAAETRFLGQGGGEWGAFLRRRGLGEVAFTPPGVSPVRYLESLGALRPGLVAAHCVRTDRDDRLALARHGVHVALCPRSNHNLGVGLPRVPEMLAAGVRLCLGTDSLASVDSLDLLEDATLLRRAFPELDPAELVRMATAGGAAALDLPDLGTLEVGKRAVLAFAPADRVPADPCAFLVSGEANLRAVAA